MIPISQELKEAVITEAIPKQMHVKITNTSNLKMLNWYKEEITGYLNWVLDINPNDVWWFYNYFKFRVDGAINIDYVEQATIMGVGFDVKIDDIDHNSAEYIQFGVDFFVEGGDEIVVYDDNRRITDFSDYARVNISFDPAEFVRLDHIAIRNTDSTKNLKCNLHIKNPRIYMFQGNDNAGVFAYTNIMANDDNINNYVAIGDFTNANLISESFSFNESICSTNKLKLGLCESSSVKFSLFATRKIPIGCDVDISLGYPEIEDKFEWNNFQISEAKKTMNGEIPVRDIVAYDRLSALNNNVYAWYNKYMWGMNLDSPAPNVPYKFDYARQIYATLRSALANYNIERPILLDSDYYAKTVYDPAEYKTTDRYFNYTTGITYNRVIFSKMTITRESWCDCCDITTTWHSAIAYWDRIDEFARGISENACCYIDLNLDNGEVVRILTNSGQIFAVPKNCTTFDVYVPYAFGNSSFVVDPNGIFVSQVRISQRKNNWYEVDKIVNGYKQLPYYKYPDSGKPTVDDIIKVSSELTLRNIVSSLCEMCGCFFRLDRNGVPQYLYPSEHGLYPSNTLFPSDNLFPKKSSEMTMPTSYYIKATYEDEQITKFGGVQVVVNTLNNTGGVVRWEYWEGEEVDSSYIIDDNIFLCSDELTYNENVNDIPDILENIYSCLDNAIYTPFEAEAIGTPFLESGDRFTLLTRTDGFESFIFERQLKGIQALKDYFCARGIQKTDKINNYEWES